MYCPPFANCHQHDKGTIAYLEKHLNSEDQLQLKQGNKKKLCSAKFNTRSCSCCQRTSTQPCVRRRKYASCERFTEPEKKVPDKCKPQFKRISEDFLCLLEQSEERQICFEKCRKPKICENVVPPNVVDIFDCKEKPSHKNVIFKIKRTHCCYEPTRNKETCSRYKEAPCCSKFKEFLAKQEAEAAAELKRKQKALERKKQKIAAAMKAADEAAEKNAAAAIASENAAAAAAAAAAGGDRSKQKSKGKDKGDSAETEPPEEGDEDYCPDDDDVDVGDSDSDEKLNPCCGMFSQWLQDCLAPRYPQREICQ